MSKENRAIIFDGNIKHKSVSQTNEKVVVRFNETILIYSFAITNHYHLRNISDLIVYFYFPKIKYLLDFRLNKYPISLEKNIVTVETFIFPE